MKKANDPKTESKDMKYKLLFALIALFTLGLCAGAEVYINEVMADSANTRYYDGADWVELYNDGDSAVSLKGWHLSDSRKNLAKWSFPAGARIEAGGYLVVLCTGEAVSGDAISTNFKLSSEGETLYLSDPSGNISIIKLPAQYSNVSMGLPAGGKSEWLYFETPTPGSKNAEHGYEERANEPGFETKAGFYSGSVRVSIDCEEGCEIRYTTDCSTPSRTSNLYTGPFTVTGTTVVRAVAVSDNKLISNIAGATYIIDDPAPENIPVVSIYSDYKYFFDDKTGFLVKGSGKTPNYDQPWEYPAQIEYFDETGTQQISQSVSAKISGHSSRGFKQKSLSVYARGDKDTFAYAFFDNREYGEYSALLLRMTSSDSHSCRLRDAVLSELSEGLGLYYAAGKPIILYINGEYYGHYNLREKANKDSLAQWEGITDEKVIEGCCILESNGMDAFFTVHGSNSEWVELMNFCRSNALDTPEKLNYVLDRVDVDSLFNYAIFDMLINNYDADNVRYYKFPGGKWTFFIHDIEAGGMNSDITLTMNLILRPRTDEAGKFPTPVLGALLEQPYYRDLFLKRTVEIIQSNFLYTRDVKPVYDKWMAELEKLMPRQIKAFPYNGFTLDEWRRNCRASMTRMRDYPMKLIDALSEKMNLTAEEKQYYFGETIALLAQYNG